MADPLQFLGGAGGAVSAGLGVIQTVAGLIGQGKAKREMAKLQAQRKPYQTPDEVFQMLQATQQNAQTGFGADTLNYLTGQADRAFSSSIGAAELLGADPNSLASLFEKRVTESMKIAGESQAQKMAEFSKYLSALNVVSENKAAEWQSRENILKDRIAAVSGRAADAAKNIGSGLSAITGAISAGQMMRLYGNQEQPNTGAVYQNYQAYGRPDATPSTLGTTAIIPRSTTTVAGQPVDDFTFRDYTY